MTKNLDSRCSVVSRGWSGPQHPASLVRRSSKSTIASETCHGEPGRAWKSMGRCRESEWIPTVRSGYTRIKPTRSDFFLPPVNYSRTNKGVSDSRSNQTYYPYLDNSDCSRCHTRSPAARWSCLHMLNSIRPSRGILERKKRQSIIS